MRVKGLSQMGDGVGQATRIKRTGVIRGLAADAGVFGAAGFGVEITHPNRGLWTGRLRLAFGPVAGRLIVGAAPWAASAGGFGMQAEQVVDLGQALFGAHMGEVDRQHAV